MASGLADDVNHGTTTMISVPFTRTFIVGFWWSILVGSVKWVGIALWGVYGRDSMACWNRGTRFTSLLMLSVIG